MADTRITASEVLHGKAADDALAELETALRRLQDAASPAALLIRLARLRELADQLDPWPRHPGTDLL